MSPIYRDPNIADGERTTYRASIAGTAEKIEATAEIAHDGPDRYVVRMHAPTRDLDVAIEQVFLREGGRVRASSYTSDARSGGRLVSREEGYFDGTAHIQFGGRVEPYPRDIVPLLGSALVLRGLDFRRGETRRFHIWLAFSVYWQVDLKVDRIEKVTVPAGTFDAWRVKVRPSFAQISGVLDKIVGGLLPDFVLHFDAAETHRVLRFAFPTGPFPWNPKAVVEAVEVS